ncbi:MAG TPA: glucose-6-phosphate dehydrogenase [Rhizomicrobium sp.]
MHVSEKDGLTLVLFGGGGDLAGRMLLPALYHLENDGLLPEKLRIAPTGRHVAQGAAARMAARASLDAHIPASSFREESWERFAARIEGCAFDASDAASIAPLKAYLDHEPDGVRIFYFATPPSLYAPICRILRDAGLNRAQDRVILEKPIGHDVASSRVINSAVGEAFAESSIFRIDHYLGKEAVQNLLALRFANFLFEPLWNARGIRQIQITVAESDGVGGRGGYYNSTGALRDMLQNHMLQLLCLVAMEPPVSLNADDVRDEKVKVLRSLRPIAGASAEKLTVRGQYTPGRIDGSDVAGFAEDSGGTAPDTETFVALRAEIDNWRWAGVPFYLRTGKRMAHRHTEIYIEFHSLPHSIFGESGRAAISSNQLIIRLQPDETIRLMVMNKVPGLDRDGFRLKELPLNLNWSDAFQTTRRRIAYERLFLDIFAGNQTLFVRRDEVDAAWNWIDGIVESWRSGGQAPLPYAAGTSGPTAALELPIRFGHRWHE